MGRLATPGSPDDLLPRLRRPSCQSGVTPGVGPLSSGVLSVCGVTGPPTSGREGPLTLNDECGRRRGLRPSAPSLTSEGGLTRGRSTDRDVPVAERSWGVVGKSGRTNPPKSPRSRKVGRSVIPPEHSSSHSESLVRRREFPGP